MKKILPYIAVLCFSTLTVLSFGQIVNPGAPTTAGTGLTKTGSALNVVYGTTANTAKQGNAVTAVAQGGTGFATATAHGVLIGNTTSPLAVTAAGTSGQCFISNGAGADPTFQACSAGGGVTSVFSLTGVVGDLTGDVTTSSSTATTLKNTGTAGTYGQVTTDAQGRVSAGTIIEDVSHGGTGVATLFAHGVVMGNGTSAAVVSNAGTAGQCFVSNGASANPTFQACGTGGIITVPNGGTGVGTLTNHGVVLGQGTANVAITSAGTSGQVLTSNGASADPTFQTAATGGAVLLATVTTTATASLDALSTFSATYDNYLIIGNGMLPASGSPTMRGQVAVAGVADGGSNYWESTPYSTATITASTTFFTVCTTTVSTGIGCNFEMRIKNANSTTLLKSVASESQVQLNATPGYASQLEMVGYSAANAITGVHLTWSGAQNFVAGTKMRIYGYNN